MKRRNLLVAAGIAPIAQVGAAMIEFPKVAPSELIFPRDHGAHLDYRIEWWYLTGVLDTAAGAPIGIQVTFFRVRTSIDPANPSRFAAHQLVFAHAAVADPAHGTFLVDQRIGRTGPSVTMAERDTDLVLDRWRFGRATDGRYTSEIPARGFRVQFAATPTQPLLLQGRDGFFPKQKQAEYASHYYSQPQLRIEAEIVRDGHKLTARGLAWLDHEWASTLLDPADAGWDWIGMNLDDGTAMTAFQIRRRADGSVSYAYASLRAAGENQPRLFGEGQVRFEPLQYWESPRTHARYPIVQRITVGDRVFETRPLLADQELDARLTGSAIYWEGASTLSEGGKAAGRGYLELTGYATPLTI